MDAAPLAIPGAPIAATRAPASETEMRRAAQQFESVFLAQMLAPMFEGLQTDGLGGGGMGEEIFRPMLIERYADALSKSGGVGVADAILRELVRLQANTETADGASRR